VRVLAFFQVVGFYTGQLESDSAAAPLIVQRDARVLDANGPATARGVVVGMGVPEAKAILSGAGVFYEWSPEPFHEASCTWLDLCTVYSDVIEPVDQHEALVDFSEIPGSRELASQLREEIERKTKCQVRVGIGGNRWVAKVAAFSPNAAKALDTPAEFVAPLSVGLLPIEPAFQRRLTLLGYRTIGEISQLPLSVLQGQFGDEGIRIRNLAHGSGDLQVKALYPPDSASVRITFDGPPDSFEEFCNGLLRLSKELGKRLIDLDQLGEEVEIVLEHEEGDPILIRRTFTKPLASPGSIWASLRLLFPEPPSRPVIGIRVRIRNLRKAERAQTPFPAISSRVQDRQAIENAVRHVHAVFGEDQIVLGCEIEEPRWKQLRKLWRSANGWSWT
jgi:nucleotidyltransferase/DNA polymerase involved in DNA repair